MKSKLLNVSVPLAMLASWNLAAQAADLDGVTLTLKETRSSEVTVVPKAVGCGVSLCPEGPLRGRIVTCNYAPAGNDYGQPPYDIE